MAVTLAKPRSSLPHRQLRNDVSPRHEAALGSLPHRQLRKWDGEHEEMRLEFTAAQAAQKDDDDETYSVGNVHCRTGSSEKTISV